MDNERDAVKRLGENIGFGRMMSLASSIWEESVGLGSFAVGPCLAFTLPCGCDRGKECSICCGTNWKTVGTAELQIENNILKSLRDELFDRNNQHSAEIAELKRELQRSEAVNASIASGNCPNIRHNAHGNKYCFLMGDRPIATKPTLGLGEK
jgi:hypothetical protein